MWMQLTASAGGRQAALEHNRPQPAPALTRLCNRQAPGPLTVAFAILAAALGIAQPGRAQRRSYPLASHAPEQEPVALYAPSGWALGNDNLLYTDTDNVQVLTSQVAVAHDLGVERAAVSARGLVDVVSAASVDVVSHATMRFDEVRLEGDLAAAYPIGDALPSLSYRISREPDYRSQGVGAGVELRVGSPDTVLGVHYTGTFDHVGRTDTPPGQFSEPLTTHSTDLGVTQNLSTQTLLRLVYTFTYQHGYMEKPYRFVPLFTRGDLSQAAADGVRLGLATFDRYRQSTRPAEEVPDDRARHALAARLLTYIAPIDGSLRVDYRFYIDDWLVIGNTLEASLYHPLGDHLRFAPFMRAYQQTAASFWERTYLVDAGEIPRYRTLDRKLSPYWAATLGARVELDYEALSAYLEFSATETHFLDFLLLNDRFALIAQIGVEYRP